VCIVAVLLHRCFKVLY